MGREIRRVPANWHHPKNSAGSHTPLFDGNFKADLAEWDESNKKWSEGLCENYGDGEKWTAIDQIHKSISYEDYAEAQPVEQDYMPVFDEPTHIRMYETCSEGTPISPSFGTPEELATWLTDNNASAFGSMTATYEQWLATCQRGFAPSAVLDSSGMRSGVAHSAD